MDEPDWQEVRRARWVVGITMKGLATGELDSISCLGYLRNAMGIIGRVLESQGEPLEYTQTTPESQ